MVTTEHVSASLRLVSNMGGTVENIRTISGVKAEVTNRNVQDLIQGINLITSWPATSAIHTRRTALYPSY